jgi:hypothetical protein
MMNPHQKSRLEIATVHDKQFKILKHFQYLISQIQKPIIKNPKPEIRNPKPQLISNKLSFFN